MLGMSAVQKHMHAVENILSGLKAKQSFTKDEINFFLNGIDAARTLLSGQEVNFDYEILNAPLAAKVEKTDVPPVAPQQIQQPKIKSAGRAILVDDEPDILEALSTMLEIAGMESTSFTDATEALKACKKSPPDVILTDLKMPKMTGLEFLKEVRKFNPDIPVIIVSGFITTETLLEAIQAGIFSAIEKPFNQTALTNNVLAANRQHKVYKLFRQGLHLLMYQFPDLDDYLKKNGKEDIAETARTEINSLLAQWKTLNTVQK